jgi:hypothetical protein
LPCHAAGNPATVIKDLLLLPVRIPLAVARFGLDVAAGLVRHAIAGTPEPPPPAAADIFRPRPPAEAATSQVIEGVTVRPEPEVGGADAEEHRRETHAAEFGSEGGAEVEVEPPWEGYDDMTTPEILARLRGADAAKLAFVHLYEASHRARRTVLRATDSEVAGRAGGNGG